MPRKPLKPCVVPGCPNLTEGKFCDKHKGRSSSVVYEKTERDKMHHERYGRQWRTIRDVYRAAHPFCEECFARGIIVPVDEVHHKIPLKEGGTNEMSNLISLCRSCHAKKHEDRWKRSKVYTY